MELNRDQERIVTSFYRKHLPDQEYSGGWRSTNHPSYLGHDVISTTFIAHVLWEGVFAQKPGITQEEFDREMIARINKVHELAGKEGERIGDNDQTPTRLGFARLIFDVVGRFGIPFEEQVKIYKLNLRLLKGWLKTPGTKIGQYSFEPRALLHTETPFNIAVKGPKDRIIATAGGYILPEGRKLALRLTSIQGEPLRHSSGLSKREHAAQYERMSKELGENWRVFLVKQAAKFCSRRKMLLIAEPPQRYGDFWQSETEFRRVQKRYEEQYSGAGLHPHPDGTWRSVPRK